MHLLRVNGLEGPVPDVAEELLGLGLEGREGLPAALARMEVDESLYDFSASSRSSGTLALQYISEP
jgi:hypothetical protein